MVERKKKSLILDDETNQASATATQINIDWHRQQVTMSTSGHTGKKEDGLSNQSQGDFVGVDQHEPCRAQFREQNEIIKDLKTRMAELEAKVGFEPMVEQIPTDDMAEQKVRDYFIGLLSTDKTTINILDLVVDLGLPPEQIERIMKKLEHEGVKLIE